MAKVVTFIWGFAAAIIITILPLWEGWPSLVLFVKFLFGKNIASKSNSIDGVMSDSPLAGGSQVGDEKILNEGSTSKVNESSEVV